MAYTPTGDENVYLNRFTQNRRAIEAYKARHGGDLEGAYQAIMGEPWPEGRSVKISHGRPELTKDRTFKSVLGKYVAPAAAIAAAPFVGGASLGFLGGGGAGVAGASGAAGTLGGAGFGLGAAGTAGALGAAGTLGAGAAGAAATGAGLTGGGGWLTRAAIPKLAGDVLGAVVTSRGSRQAAETQRAGAEFAGRRQDRTTQDILRRLDASRQAYPNAPPPSSPYPIGPGTLESIRSLAPAQAGPAAGQPGPGGAMVTVQAPDGETREVPAQQAQRYVQAGARIMS